jgi:hypothetical protein
MFAVGLGAVVLLAATKTDAERYRYESIADIIGSSA